jgi:ABC-type multidrug transport system permease subunit
MNPFRGFTAILYKEFLVVLRDPFTLFFMFFPPLIEMIAFGYALDTDVKHMKTAVLDEDRTAESRRFVERLVNTEAFRVVEHVGSVAELDAAVRQGRAYVGVQIPPGFTRSVHDGHGAAVQVLIDGSASSIASAALNTSQNLALRHSLELLARESGTRALPVEVRPQILYNPSMRSPNFFVPGVIGVMLQIATTFATAMALVRERERGTLEQLFVSPLSRWGLMLGKLVPYAVIGAVMSTVLVAIMVYLFKVPIHGSVWALTVATGLYLFALLSLGLLISTRAENQMQALQLSMVFVMPSVFFSGFIFPRDTMPWIFQAIGACLPTTYFIDLSRAIVLRGAGLGDYVGHLVILAGMGLGLFVLCALRFKQKIG